MSAGRPRERRHLGDFPTPPGLARDILKAIRSWGVPWTRLLEPTCGSGTFLHAAIEEPDPPAELVGIEIDEAHCTAAGTITPPGPDVSVRVIQANLFDLDLRRDLRWTHSGPLLVVGNPPWITSAELGRLPGSNGPDRRNLRSLPGLAALTGASNFDLAEAVWIKLIEELADQQPTIALLCKTAVARSVLEFVRRQGLDVVGADLHEIDAARWFRVSVRAGLFRLTLGAGGRSVRVPVYPTLESQSPREVMAFHEERLIADVERLGPVAFAIGACPLTWRQGLKHDAAAVMELTADDPLGPWRNGLGEVVDVEPEALYPLLKGGDVRKPPADRPYRRVIVTQRRIGEPTETLADRAPRLWAYLRRHAERFNGRKSSIYRGRPPFALFGVGPYSFSDWKVAVSGLHRPACFRAIGPDQGRPAMLDDTCYLLPCESSTEAAVLASLCNHRVSLDLIEALSFPGSKRPVTKGMLQRLDLSAILERADRREVEAGAELALSESTGGCVPHSGAIANQLERLARRFHDAANPPGPRSEDSAWPSPGSTTSAAPSGKPAP